MQMSREEVKERLHNLLKTMLSLELGLSVDKIDSRVPIEKYGINSIMIMKFTNQLEKKFGALSKTILFEYETIQALSNYLYESKIEKVYNALNIKAENAAMNSRKYPESRNLIAQFINKKEVTQNHSIEKPSYEGKGWDIAIIGLAGQYPNSEDVNELWKNLKDGVDCITEIPQERWDHSRYYSPDKTDRNKTYAKWGGFLDHMDCFDPLFFHFSPAEAEAMDPQERLFLQCVHHAIEDAGYDGHSMTKEERYGMTNNVGVFVGVMYEEYQLYGAQAQQKGQMYSLNGSEASIANRISYVYGFHGPSMSVDTMCSSSLTALQLACKSIMSHECEVAVTGGVNVSLHPNKFIMLGQGRFSSDVGRCESFGEGGSGYVPGEGIGAVILKPLKKAIEDGDHIYGVIKGVALNHGGKNGGYTVPNPHAQAGVIRDAWEQAGINPKAISYIEAHGTGTSLGDPIEISALNRAFEGKVDQKQFCNIGSIKSNIGHCESAAGIAGITKVLLQMKCGMIVPSLHSSILNKNIDFENSPFTVPQELIEWKQPKLLEDGEYVTYPRIAGISAFGAGGSNAHVVIEEYIPKKKAIHKENQINLPIFVLSAKSKEQVVQQAEHLAAWMKENEDARLSNIAFTLLVGREAMEQRVAILADAREELIQKLEEVAKGDFTGVQHTTMKSVDSILGIFNSDDEMEELIEKWIQGGKFTKLAQLWVNGFSLQWENVLHGGSYQRLSLPGYPFLKERYWAPNRDQQQISQEEAIEMRSFPYPLIHFNTSDFNEQRYTTVFTGSESFFSNHVVAGRKTLPAVVFMEMVYEGLLDAMHVTKESGLSIQYQDIMWLRPCVIEDKHLKIHIGFTLEDEESISFQVYSGETDASEEELTIYCTGAIKLDADFEEKVYELQEVKTLNDVASISGEAVYDYLAQSGLKYGTEQRAIDTLYRGETTLLAKLELPRNLKARMKDYTLYPAIMDSAIQACAGFSQEFGIFDEQQRMQGGNEPLSIPFAVGAVTIYRGCKDRMWAYLKVSEEGHKLQDISIDLCDESGNVCVSFGHVMFRRQKESEPVERLIILSPESKELTVGHAQNMKFNREGVILCNISDEMKEAIRSMKSWNQIHEIDEIHDNMDQSFSQSAKRLFEYLKQEVLKKQEGITFLQVVVPYDGDSYLLKGLSGIIKTVRLEKPQISCQLVAISLKEEPSQIKAYLEQASGFYEEPFVTCQNGHVYCDRFQKMSLSEEKQEIFLDSGVYLITGGLGRLGMIFAKEIAAKTKNAVIVLTGRSGLNNEKLKMLEEIRKLGATCVYYPADMSNMASIETLVQSIIKDFKGLHGVIHCAGITNDSFIYKKETADFVKVLEPKVSGTWNLDQATKKMKLSFFLLFSSLSSVTGNVGQADYATGNSFMDCFAHHRNQMVSDGVRYGKTISYNWPFWKNGGFRLDSSVLDSISDRNGLTALDTNNAFIAFYGTYQSGAGQIIVTQGEERKISAMFERAAAKPKNVVAVKAEAHSERSVHPAVNLKKAIKDHLSNIFSEALKIPVSKIATDSFFDVYGVDSIFIMRITERMEKTFGVLSKTLLFEHQTIDELAEYFVKNHADRLKEMFSVQEEPIAIEEKQQDSFKASSKHSFQTRLRGFRSHKIASENVHEKTVKDIAIIGVAGRYPQADDIEEFWKNLCGGKDCITEIPMERWDYRKYFSEDKDQAGTSYSKWGGFLKDIDAFDPMFFHMPPVEAKFIDPQERLFLQSVWEAIEDAGYTRKSLADEKVGVFAGIMYAFYQMYQMETHTGKLVGSSSYASVANRISYFFDFKGPSIALDTMCSSSLTTVYLACESIKSGAATMAVAGGVNLSMHPQKYTQLCQGGFLSTDGRCRSFGAGGDGYVPGEGVGAVILKSLDRAIEDKDHVYGVIKGACINAGGKVSGYTVPNQNAQRELITQTLTDAKIDPRTISYVEAHGTGTSLGDPIEVNAITQAYQKYTNDRQYCSIGSMKSNIGHLESAAGIAALTKVLLQMKYKKLVPSLHSRQLNPYIHFSETPFYVQQEVEEWKQPVIDGKKYPRRAAISSFGAGGSNAHLIVEEYEKEAKTESKGSEQELLFVLSAKNENRMKAYAQKMYDFILSTFEPERKTKADSSCDLTRLTEILRNVLNVNMDTFDEMEVFEELGIDAYQLEQLRNQIIEHTGLEITEVQMMKCTNLHELMKLLKSGQDMVMETEHPSLSLEDIAYTLQGGREAMEERVILFAADYKGLLEGLQDYLTDNIVSTRFRHANVNESQERFGMMLRNDGMKEYLKRSLRKGNLKEVAEYWLIGAQIDWSVLYQGKKKNKVSLPTYPFMKEHYLLQMAEIVPKEQISAKFSQTKMPLSCIVNKDYSIEKKEAAMMIQHAGMRQESIIADDELQSLMEKYIKQAFVEVMNIPYQYLSSTSDYEAYGIDSIHIKSINKYFEMHFGKLSSTLMFTYKTIRALAGYFVQEQKEAVLNILNKEQRDDFMEESSVTGESVENPEEVTVKSNEEAMTDKNAASEEMTASEQKIISQEIAIIGISGKFPQANELDDFLKCLEEGKDCITEIPKERWDYEDYPEITCKWGGFIEDADKFDPQFFNISPANAIFMDPQERLFVQYVWKCLEDAGYTPEHMEKKDAKDTRANVAVYAGVTFNEYGLYGAGDIVNGKPMPLNSQIYSIANRVSYLFNFGGPSLSVDTACSSSLYAIHLGCESILKGECEMAIAGGVNLSLHPSKYITLNWAKFLASDGHCHTFGNGGDGYVPGEGVGAVLLKPLWKAQQDHDHIYGIIKGSSANHGGKTYGYSVPNPVAQSDIIEKTLQKARINPRTISYVEAHGTGTALGDPLEVAALSEVYKKYTADKQFCAIGSVKSNIGHLEAAAGISQLIKVILQIQKKELFPSELNSDELNPNIDFENSPFYVQRVKKEWRRPVLVEGGVECPRRAAISAFGVGGVNVHMIVEEYEASEENRNDVEEEVYIPFSAKSEKVLKQYVAEWVNFIDQKAKSEAGLWDIRDVADTMQHGRIELAYRAAFIAKSFEQLKSLMTIYLSGNKNENIYTGKVLLVQGKDWQVEEESQLIESNPVKYSAYEWVHGRKASMDIKEKSYEPKKVSLPGYPFEKESYWLYSKLTPAKDNLKTEAKTDESVEAANIIRKLKDTFEGQRMELLVHHIQDMFAEILCFTDGRKPDVEEGFFALGLESVASRQAQNLLEDEFGLELDDQLFFNYPNIMEVAMYILSLIDFDTKEVKGNTKQQVEEGETLLFKSQWVKTKTLQVCKSMGKNKIWFIDLTEEMSTAIKGMISRSAQKNIRFLKKDENLLQVFGKIVNYPDYIVINGSVEDKSEELEHIEERIEGGIQKIFDMMKYLVGHSQKPTSILYLYKNEETVMSAEFGAFSGFFKSVHLEHSMFTFKMLQMQSESYNAGTIASMILNELKAGCNGEEIAYQKEGRYEKRLFEFTENDFDKPCLFKENGVYLMVGGCGSLAAIISKHLGSKYRANLILTSRRNLGEQGIMQIKEIENAGGKAIYIKADVSNREDVNVLVAKSIERFGHIDGVLHMAGVIKDAKILNKEVKDFKEVLMPKVYGTQYLDEALKDMKLDFFVLFSSLAAVIGNIGQSDYCYANSFIDEFAAVRNRLCEKGLRSGKTYSINWSFWKNGGMTIEADTQKWMDKKLGLLLMENEQGIEVLERSLRTDSSQVILMNGRPEKIRKMFQVEDADFEVKSSPGQEVVSEVKAAFDEKDVDVAQSVSEAASISKNVDVIVSVQSNDLLFGNVELPSEYDQMSEETLLEMLDSVFIKDK